jgi:acylphosphatase
VVRRHVTVQGFVQGVGFRISLARAAQVRGVSGWVRNRGDGTVEAILEGPADAVDAMVAWCREGPRGAQVDRVDVVDEAPEGVLGFDVR